MTDDQRTEKAAYLLKLFTNPARIRVLLLLSSNGEMAATAIEQQLLIEQSQLSHHLIKMRDNGLLAVRRQGRNSFYSLVEVDLAEGLKRYVDNQITSIGQTE